MHDGDSPQLISGESAAQFTMNVWQAYTPQFSLVEFRTRLTQLGFVDDWDLELLEARYFDGMSLRRIEEEFSWVSKSEVQRRLKRLHAELVNRGVVPRKTK